jgi:hypothetical protein
MTNNRSQTWCLAFHSVQLLRISLNWVFNVKWIFPACMEWDSTILNVVLSQKKYTLAFHLIHVCIFNDHNEWEDHRILIIFVCCLHSIFWFQLFVHWHQVRINSSQMRKFMQMCIISPSSFAHDQESTHTYVQSALNRFYISQSILFCSCN